MATDTDILEAMKQVEDPELGVNVVDLGLVYGVDQEEEGRKVRLDMTLTTVACPLTDMIEGATNAALIGLDDIQEVEINWVWSPPWGPERLTEDGADHTSAGITDRRPDPVGAEALVELGKAIDAGYDDLAFLEVDTDFESLREEPAYQVLLAKLRSRKLAGHSQN